MAFLDGMKMWRLAAIAVTDAHASKSAPLARIKASNRRKKATASREVDRFSISCNVHILILYLVLYS